ncbi:HlyD family efflux transporter periplasmic adaptor subunit [Empedobacter sp.]|uniref:HlyD family secretion protein n=1 Tax=Empedobacter sp. TaxID=1927715 RepID=UPI0028AE8905|nr:HlyD family efflux transporter periplasmic adaptor subunit [Empedobacter sp.]
MPNHLDNIELRSESVQEILTNPPSWIIRWGITVIAFVLVIILAISYFVKYPDFINAQISITTQNPPEKIEARTSGKLEKVLVVNHQNVSSNEVLAYIQTNANYQDILKLKQLLTQYKPIDFPIEKTRNLALGELDSKYIIFEKAYSDYHLQRQLQPYAVEKTSGLQTISEINSRIQNLRKQKEIELSKLKLAKIDFDRYQKMVEKGIVPNRDLEQSRIAYLQAQQSVDAVDLSISQLNESKVGANKGIESSSINQKQDETSYYITLLQSYDELKNALRLWEQNYLFISSDAGKVSFQEYWSKNQFVKAGDVVFTIFPNNKNNLLGKLIVPAQNSGKIKTNQKVLIKLDNYPYQQYGIIKGKVKNISLSPDRDGNYYVEVELPKELMTSYNKKLDFDKELSGSAEIVTEDLRLIERVFYQFRKIFQYQ